MRGRGPAIWVALGVAAAAAAWVLHYRIDRAFIPAHDLYAYFYPKVAYALACAQDGGRGLLWNPYQNCGQPFFAISQTGVLYPPYLLFLLFGLERGLTAVLWLHLVIGGAGAYLLGRYLGARPLAALAGALAFEMGNAMIGLTISSPTHAAPLAWMPLALLACERLLRQPSLRRAALLAVVLAIAILPGMPQTVFFIYQLIALRIVWELATRPESRRVATLWSAGLGLGLAAALAAVQLVPELEVAGLSLRSAELVRTTDLNPLGKWDSQLFRHQLFRRSIGQPFLPIPCMLAAAAVLLPRLRRAGVFYLGAALLFFALSLGPDTPLFGWYSRLPGGTAFRDPRRFVWVTSFCVAVAAALGSEALLSSWRDRRRAITAAGVMALPLIALWLAAATAPTNVIEQYERLWKVTLQPWQLVFNGWERALAALLLALPAIALLLPAATRVAGCGVLAVVVAQLLAAPWAASGFHYPEPPPIRREAALFDRLRATMSAQDRIYIVHDQPLHSQFSFMAKTASILRLPDILDYEPLVTRRYAELSVMLRAGQRFRGLSGFLWRGPEPKAGFRRPLLDLTAARYVIVAPRFAEAVRGIEPPLVAVPGDGALAVWENPRRLPRARFVPRLEVVPDGDRLLDRLAAGADDPTAVALVEAPPASGFLGEAGAAPGGSASIVRNDPEHLAIEVEAPQRGFLVLADQYFPGWTASRDGEPIEILRANYAFRAVEVPAGRSTIELRYAPRSLMLGAAISLASVVLVIFMTTKTTKGTKGSD